MHLATVYEWSIHKFPIVFDNGWNVLYIKQNLKRTEALVNLLANVFLKLGTYNTLIASTYSITLSTHAIITVSLEIIWCLNKSTENKVLHSHRAEGQPSLTWCIRFNHSSASQWIAFSFDIFMSIFTYMLLTEINDLQSMNKILTIFCAIFKL